jgi:hypothetical protein
MRRLAIAMSLSLVVGQGLVGCGSAPRRASPPANTAKSGGPTSTSADLAKLDPALPDLVDRAVAIVSGTATVDVTEDGYLGQITVDAVVAGVAPAAVSFISAPLGLPEHGVYFLAEEPGAPGLYRLVDDGTRVGFPREWADAIGAAAAAPAQATVDKATAALAADIATFRAAAGEPWTPSQTPAVEAARRIFDHLPLAGRMVADVEATLGEPDTKHADGSVEYVRHMGEVGVIRRLRVKAGRITAVEIHLTQ